jgi:hypothetical protein
MAPSQSRGVMQGIEDAFHVGGETWRRHALRQLLSVEGKDQPCLSWPNGARTGH